MLFQIALALQQQRLIILQLKQELREQRAIERDPLLLMLALVFAPLLQNEVPLPF